MLREKASNAAIWSLIEVFAAQGISFVISIALARMLLPEHFGTVAILSIFTACANLLINAGFTTAIIRDSNATQEDISTAFWCNIVIGLIMASALYFSGGILAAFFDVKELRLIAQLFALNLFFSALSSIQNTLLVKELLFKKIAIIAVLRTSVSGCVAVYLAFTGYGIWALVAQSLLSNFLNVFLLWWLGAWRPMLALSVASMRKLIRFGGFIFGASFIELLASRGYVLILGKFYGVADLGVYSRAENTQDLAKTLSTRGLAKVAFPMFSKLNHDPPRMLNAGRESIRLIMFVCAPAFIGLSLLSELFIKVLFGQNWLASAPVLQVLLLATLVFPVVKFNQNMLQALGHAKLVFRIAFVRSVLSIFGLVIGSFYGLVGVAAGYVIAAFLLLILQGYYMSKIVGYGYMSQLSDISPSIIIGAVAAVVMGGFVQVVNLHDMAQLVAASAIGAVVYFLVNFIFRTRSLFEFQAQLVVFSGQFKK